MDRTKRDKRSRSAKEEREREVRGRRASAERAEHLWQTFGLGHRHLRPCLKQTFDLNRRHIWLHFWPASDSAQKAYQIITFEAQNKGVHRWVKTAFTAFDLGGKGVFKEDIYPWCASKIVKSVQMWPLQNLWPHIWRAVKTTFRAVEPAARGLPGEPFHHERVIGRSEIYPSPKWRPKFKYAQIS